MRSTEVNMICNACYEETNGKEVLCESCLEIDKEKRANLVDECKRLKIKIRLPTVSYTHLTLPTKRIV